MFYLFNHQTEWRKSKKIVSPQPSLGPYPFQNTLVRRCRWLAENLLNYLSTAKVHPFFYHRNSGSRQLTAYIVWMFLNIKTYLSRVRQHKGPPISHAYTGANEHVNWLKQCRWGLRNSSKAQVKHWSSIHNILTMIWAVNPRAALLRHYVVMFTH